MANKPLPDIDRLRDRLVCDADKGFLYWKEISPSEFAEPYRAKTWNKRYAGKEALAFVGAGGYKTGHFDGHSYVAHRIIWAMANGFDPAGLEVDHINGETSDNRIANLRAVPHSINGRNQRRCKNNTSGVNGIHKLPSGNWHVRVTLPEGKRLSVGTFQSLKEALAAQSKAALVAGFHPNHGR